MDKRTLLFVVALSLTLLGVNMFFDHQNQESRAQWHEQQKSKLVQKRQALQAEIGEHTAKPQDLPLQNIFADKAGRNFLTTGVKAKHSILTLAWTKDLPSSVYADGVEYFQAFKTENINDPVVYEASKDEKLPISDLPYFGTYELQLITPQPEKAGQAPLITLGNYTDGVFSLPLQKLNKLEEQLEEQKANKPPLPGDAIVLLKTPEGYLPVAVYHAKNQSLIQLEQLPDLKTELTKPKVSEDQELKEEQYYVLENNYQQLVFSSKGGALIEINLPFATKENENSVVKEIDFDREIIEKHPQNAYFPMRSYFTPGKSTTGSFEEHSKGHLGGYYPLIRRDLILTGGKKSVHVLPEYYAFNLVSEYPELPELIYTVTHFDEKKIVFEAAQRNRKIIKTYTLNTGDKIAPYCFDLSIRIEGDSRGLWLTTGIPEVEWISNGTAPALKYRITRNGKVEINSVDIPKESVSIGNIYPDWICDSNGFLGLIVDPLTEIDPGFRAQAVAGTSVPSRMVLIDAEYDRYKAENMPGYMMLLPLNGKGGTMNFRIFAGPFATDTLKAVDSLFSDAATGYNPDYIGSQTFHGWFSFISSPFSKFLFLLMNFFHMITGSWGFSIILLTVALRLMLYPLNAWSTKSMLKMQLISPEVQKIQERHKKDPKKAQLEIMNLYRDKGVNPISGCFPLLIQMPFLIGMFDLLKSTFELRGASFIPGWIDNLAAPDVLFSWSMPIFFIGTQFHLLPILLGGVMWLQQQLMSTLPKDSSLLTEQQKQQKMMGTLMPVIFTVMFYSFPSGLNLYWLSSMLLGILQQWWTQRTFKMPEKAVVKKG